MGQNEGSDQYEVIEFPAILDIPQDDGSTIQKPLWPEFFDMKALLRTKASMPLFQWNAQYQQNPTAEEAAIVKREWWKIWKEEDPPECEYIIMSLDSAAEAHNRADYTALTTWGVFLNEEDMTKNLILLNTYKKRVEWVELKRDVLEQYREWEPDGMLIEKKATGAPLIYELRSMGIPVQEFTPSKGQDKIARLNAVSDIIASGKVWVPRTRWAEELVDEIAAFPSGEHDDLVDATTLALMRFRQGGFLRLPTDEPEEIQWFKGHRRERFYTV
jgi:predicted phage terminase large subunit-like protein